MSAGRGTLRRTAPAVLVVIAVTAVVAMAATGNGLFVPAVDLHDGWERSLRVAGAVAALSGLAVLVMRGNRLRSLDDPDADSTGGSLAAAAMIMGVVALMAYLGPRIGVANDPLLESSSTRAGANDRQAGSSGVGLLPPIRGTASGDGTGGLGSRAGGDGENARPDRTRTAGTESGSGRRFLRRLSIVLVWALLIVAAVLGFRVLVGGPGPPPEETEPEPPVAAAAAEAGLRASMDDVIREGGDPRQQITAAYHRLLIALAAAGAPRQPQEAPHEYLIRALGPLGVRPDPMHHLTGLYVLAQFSEHPVTERHRARAVEALEEALLGLQQTKVEVAVAGAVRVPELSRT